MLKFSNTFINIHFLIFNTSLVIELLSEDFCTSFMSCSFTSKATIVNSVDARDKYLEALEKYMSNQSGMTAESLNAMLEKYLRKLGMKTEDIKAVQEEHLKRFDMKAEESISENYFKLGNESKKPEDKEKSELSPEEIEEILDFTKKEIEGSGQTGAYPALIVNRGICLVINCLFNECLGTAVLSTLNKHPEDDDILPLAYLINCTIANCGSGRHGGVEVRLYGSCIIENCKIYDNGQGIGAWRFPLIVVIRNSEIFNNIREGIMTEEHFVYDNCAQIYIDNCNIHHNQIGLSLQFSREISVTNSSIHSNRSWGIALRNSTIANFDQNDIFRNECGGVRIMFNRFWQTVFSNNRIHDHTGPGLIQSRYLSENQENLCGILTDTYNREPILLLDNLCYNNELHYADLEDLKTFSSKACHLPSCGEKGKFICRKCLYVHYCSNQCQMLDLQDHVEFCFNFREKRIVKIELEKQDVSPSNETIKDFTRKMSLKSLSYKREFLVKVSNGNNHYGFDFEDLGLWHKR